ncbi:TldD/PmbA family protein [Chloroflexota bacterium]
MHREEILEKVRQVEAEAEVFSVATEETEIRFEANRLKHLQTSQTNSVALRLVKDGRIGYATAAGEFDADALVRGAVETAQFGMEAKFQFPGKAAYPEVAVFDDAVPRVGIDKMMQLGKEMIARITSDTQDIVCGAGVEKGTVSVSIVNSRGGEASYRKSFFSMALEGSLIRGTDMLFVGESQSSCHPLLESGTVTEEVLRQLELAKGRAITPTSSLPVIFSPNGVASAFLFPLMTAFSGKTVLEGASPVGGRLGQQVFDRKFSLYDDATLAYRPGSRLCDDEGVPSQRTPLIQEGIVSNYLYDLQTAAQAKRKSTGSGSRARGVVTPAPAAFVVAPGEATFGEMVGDIKEGLVIEYLMGAQQGNVLGGDFSGNVLLGYKIENGKMVGRVKDTMVSGNIYQVLREIVAVSTEVKWVGSSLLAPYIYCPGLSVATQG